MTTIAPSVKSSSTACVRASRSSPSAPDEVCRYYNRGFTGSLWSASTPNNAGGAGPLHHARIASDRGLVPSSARAAAPHLSPDRIAAQTIVGAGQFAWTLSPTLVYLEGMGAWGHGSFANDSAMDWLGELREGDPSLVHVALTAVAEAADDAYLEVDECSAALAAADLVAAGRGKGEERLDAGARAWFEEHRAAVTDRDLDLARRAVDRVFRRSELRELWDENGADTEWHADVRELLQRLTVSA